MEVKKPLSQVCLYLLLTLALQVPEASAEDEQSGLGVEEVLPSQPFLQRSLPQYRNYAFRTYTNYPNHAFPYADTPAAHYSSFGDYLITGYDVYSWTEQRTPGLEWGSMIEKDINVFQPVFDYLVVARDGYRDWGYSVLVGDGLIARFTPMTLSKVDFNGVRLDVSTPRVKFTGLGSRIERPNWRVENPADWTVDDIHFADDSTLLLGSRVEAEIGGMQVGLNGVNMHVYQSTKPGNSMKGVVRSDHPLISWVVVRFSDDSPADGRGGAVVQEAELIVNGMARPDIEPRVIRHRADAQLQVGSISRVDGSFRPSPYNSFGGFYQTNSLYYRGRNEIPLFADYLYRFDHAAAEANEDDEAAEDVADNTNLPGLLATFAIENPDGVLRADGEEQLIYMFDVSQEEHVESVAVEALVSNDYKIEVATLIGEDTRARNRQSQFSSTYYKTVLRADGNVQDQSNLERVRFEVGENTAIFTYSADMRLRLPGLEVTGEYARSSVYSRYPAQVMGTPTFDQGSRFADRGEAYFINAVHWFERGRAGLEYFSINPDFQTEMRTYLPFDLACCTESPFGGLANSTVYWELVQDNEDGDRYPDRRLGNILGSPNDRRDFDIDGVFPGQDEDNDGFPDTNRNGNTLPDYEEPFLMYDVEPNEYVYGADRNNNDEPDAREDDLEVDYPYDADQRGHHLFGQFDLTPYWSVSVGRYDVEQIAGGGRNLSTYGLLSYRRESLGRLRRLFLENNFRRVRDDIPDEYSVLVERPQRGLIFGFRGLQPGDEQGSLGVPVFSNQFRQDPLLYEDSYVNEVYVEARVHPWSTLNLVQRSRVRLNWQQGGELPDGRFQRGGRLDYWTSVSRADYTWHLGELTLQPQFKFLLLRLVQQQDAGSDVEAGGDRTLRSEWSAIPILRLTYPLMSRTKLETGIQGFGPLPYRFEDSVKERNDFERRTAFATLTNRSKYFGYDLYTIVGFQRDEKLFDDEFRHADEFGVWSFFVRALIGFSEYGRPI